MPSEFLSGFPIPDSLVSEQFRCEPLTPAHVDLDYEAVMSSRDFLRQWSQSTWPEDHFSLQDNLADLVRHAQEHADRVAYTFTILSPDKKQCLGCLYVNPNERIAPLTAREREQLRLKAANMRYWLRQSISGSDIELIIIQELIAWFVGTWKTKDILFSCNRHTPTQIALFKRSGLRLWMELAQPGRSELLWCVEEEQ